MKYGHTFFCIINMLTKRLPADENGKKLPEKLRCIEELILYLTMLNDSVMVYVKKIYVDAKGFKVYEMSNGFSYTKNADGEWCML